LKTYDTAYVKQVQLGSDGYKVISESVEKLTIGEIMAPELTKEKYIRAVFGKTPLDCAVKFIIILIGDRGYSQRNRL